MIFAHHHGKPSETGGEKAYFGRGASTFGALSRAVFTLRRDLAKGEDYVILECAKIKGPSGNITGFEVQASEGQRSQEEATLTVREIGLWADVAGRFQETLE